MTRKLEALDYSRSVLPLFAQAARTAYVHSIFTTAVNIAVDDTLLTLLSSEKPRMPNGARLPSCIMDELYAKLSTGAQVRVGEGKLLIPMLDLTLHLADGAAWEPVPPVTAQGWQRATVAAHAHMLARHLAQRAQPDGLASLVKPLLLHEPTQETPLGRIALPLLRLLVRDCPAQDAANVERAARGLAGLGPGLTPSGDDTLGGFIAVLALIGLQPAMDVAAGKRLAEVIAGAARPRTTLLSATLLAHAARGEVAEQVGELLVALSLPPDASAAVLQAAERVLEFGACSGGDTLFGLLLGFQAAGIDWFPHQGGARATVDLHRRSPARKRRRKTLAPCC